MSRALGRDSGWDDVLGCVSREKMREAWQSGRLDTETIKARLSRFYQPCGDDQDNLAVSCLTLFLAYRIGC